MTVKELIERLQEIEDKSKEVKDAVFGMPIEDIMEFSDDVYI